MKTKNFKTALLSILLTLGITSFCFAQKTSIEANNLPKKAKSFINQHFNGEKISYVLQDQEYYLIDEYEVVFTEGTKIEFKANGDWKEISNKGKALKSNLIPENITSYSHKTFPQTHIVKIEKNRWNYEIKLSNGLELEFDTKGNFKKLED